MTLNLVLASSSPRRAELLTRIGVAFRVRPSDADESSDLTDPGELVVALALKKARVVQGLEPGAVVLGADTVVALEGAILGKPRDREDNLDGLRRLSGRWHEVYTGLALLTPEAERTGVERTLVKFRDLTEAEIRGYVGTGEGLDKAGGYGIQNMGSALVERIEGDYFNIVGLPIVRLLALARELGLNLLPWVEA